MGCAESQEVVPIDNDINKTLSEKMMKEQKKDINSKNQKRKISNLISDGDNEIFQAPIRGRIIPQWNINSFQQALEGCEEKCSDARLPQYGSYFTNKNVSWVSIKEVQSQQVQKIITTNDGPWLTVEQGQDRSAITCALIQLMRIEKQLNENIISDKFFPQNENGIPSVPDNSRFIFCLFANGCRRILLFDDRLPIITDNVDKQNMYQIATIRCKSFLNDDNMKIQAIWPSLAEKALLILTGQGYDKCSIGFNDAIFYLSQFIPDSLFKIDNLFQQQQRNSDIHTLQLCWDNFRIWIQQGYTLISLTTKKKDSKIQINNLECEQIGLKNECNYAVIDTAEIEINKQIQQKQINENDFRSQQSQTSNRSNEQNNNQINNKKKRLILLQDPNGKSNWTGPFSRSDKKNWTQQAIESVDNRYYSNTQNEQGDKKNYGIEFNLIQQTNHKSINDNQSLFWIDVESAQNYFSSGYLCWNPSILSLNVQHETINLKLPKQTPSNTPSPKFISDNNISENIKSNNELEYGWQRQVIHFSWKAENYLQASKEQQQRYSPQFLLKIQHIKNQKETMKNENEKEQTDDPSEISDQLQHNYSRHRVWLLLNKHIPQRAYGGGISIEAEQEEEKMQFGLNIVRQGKYRPYIGRIMKQNQQIITSQENEGKFVLMKLEEEIISNQRIDTNEQQTNDLIDGFYTIIISLKETPRKVKDDLHFSLLIYSTIDQYDPFEVEIEHIPLIHPNQCPLISGQLITKPLFLFGHNRTMSKYVVDKYTPIENNTEQQPVYSNNLSKVSFITSNILNTTISSDELQQKEQNQSERYKDEDGDDDYDMDRGAQIRKLEEEDLEVGRKLIGKHRVVVVKQTSVNRLEGISDNISHFNTSFALYDSGNQIAQDIHTIKSQSPFVRSSVTPTQTKTSHSQYQLDINTPSSSLFRSEYVAMIEQNTPLLNNNNMKSSRNSGIVLGDDELCKQIVAKLSNINDDNNHLTGCRLLYQTEEQQSKVVNIPETMRQSKNHYYSALTISGTYFLTSDSILELQFKGSDAKIYGFTFAESSPIKLYSIVSSINCM